VAEFENNLRQAVAVAFSEEAPAPDMALEDEVVDTPTAVGVAGCTACQGACCAQGAASFAFIGPRMMVRQHMRYPEKSEDDLIQHYMDQLPEAAAEGRCLYQGPMGCVLPREDRAQICNSFKCWSLKQALLIEAENPEAEVAIAAAPFGGEMQNHLVVTASDVPDPDAGKDGWDPS
jgi:hypothetical protein